MTDVGCNCGRCSEFITLAEIDTIRRGKGFCPDCADQL